MSTNNIKDIINTIIVNHVFFEASHRGDFETYDFLVQSMTDIAQKEYIESRVVPALQPFKQIIIKKIKSGVQEENNNFGYSEHKWLVIENSNDLMRYGSEAIQFIEDILPND